MGLLTLLFLLLISPARAELNGSDFSLSGNVGPHNTYSWGAKGHLRFERGELHGSYDKQIESAVPGNPETGDQHSENASGGFAQYLNDDFGLGLDYDRLRDTVQSLTTDGLKVTGSFKIVTLAYRHARNKLDESFIPAGQNKNVRGAFTYQSTYSVSVDIALGKDDSLAPSFAYSTFTPDLEKFSSVLSRPRVQAQTGFSSTLQTYERYSVGMSYEHTFSPEWNAGVDGTFAMLIVGQNPLVTLSPSLTHHWTNHFATRLNFNETYQPAAPNWTAGLEAIFRFDPERAPAPVEANEAPSVRRP